MKTGYLIILLSGIFLLAACTSTTKESDIVPSAVSPTPSYTPTHIIKIPTAAFTQTATQSPTLTSSSTSTNTPTPTLTFTPEPTPFGGLQEVLIAYQEDWFGDIFISAFNGQERINLTEDIQGLKRFGVWSPDGGLVFFIVTKEDSWSSDALGELWVANSDGTNKHPLWKSTLSTLWSMSWMADQEQFITYCPNEGIESINEICLVRLADFQIQETGYEAIFPGPVPSPSINAYAWIGVDETTNRLAIHIWSRDTKNLVTAPVKRDGYLVWLPESQGLLYAIESGAIMVLYHVSLEGSLTQLRSINTGLMLLDVLPDGSRVLMQRYSRSGGNFYPEEHGLMDVDGNNLIWLSEFAQFLWTPDGKHIVGQSWEDGTMYWIDPKTGEATQTDWLNWTAYLPLNGGRWYLQPVKQVGIHE